MAGCAVVVVALGSILLALYGPDARIKTANPQHAADISDTPAATATLEAPSPLAHAEQADTDSFVASLPAQFQGTRVDGAITVGPQGELVPTHALRQLFDYFISGYGDYAKAGQARAVRDTIGRYAASQGFDRTVRGQLLDLFDTYIRLRRKVVRQSPSFADTDMATRLHILQDMRVAELGPQVAQAFYGQEQQAMNRALAQRDGQTPADPPSDANARASLPSRLAADVASARKQGASAARIHAMRLKAVGAQATARLEALDDRRSQWRARYHDYTRQRDAIRQSAMSKQDQQKAVQALRARSFQPAEQRRVKALDRIATAGDTSG